MTGIVAWDKRVCLLLGSQRMHPSQWAQLQNPPIQYDVQEPATGKFHILTESIRTAVENIL